MKAKLTLLAVAIGLMSGPAMSQAPSPAPAKPSMLSRMKAAAHPTPAAKPAPKAAVPATKPAAVAANGQAPRTAKSLACSKQADAQNVHGKARKAFMSHCKKA